MEDSNTRKFTNYESIFENAAKLWHSLPKIVPESIANVPSELHLFNDGVISVMYAPFSHINHYANLVIVGITPGWQQTEIAFQVASQNPNMGREMVEQEIKNQAAFAGTMRTNLIEMLDGLSVHHCLNVDSTRELFGPRSDLLHTTSLLRYPVFKKGNNYSGHSPNPLDHAFLMAMIDSVFIPELASVPNALVVPLGKAVEGTLEHLSKQGLLPIGRILRGFPHPSGANGHRKRMYDLSQQSMKAQVHQWFNAT
jgi:hypothetical protein